jgi:DNA polymerase-3 subunit alpha
MDSSFCHLHFHTCYSLLDGATRIDDAVKRAAEYQMPALAITDHGVMHGAIDFYKACKKHKIKPILGCEVYTCDKMTERRRNEDGSQSNHLVLLATNAEGYQNLARLVSLGHLEGYYYKPRIDRETLARHAKGLIGTTACLKGEVTEKLWRGDFDGALRRAGEYEDILGKGNYYLELQNHGLEEQRLANAGLLDLRRKTGMPLICSNDVHYLKAEHAEAHEVMLCLQTGTVMSDPKRLKYGSDQFFMKSPREMWELFKDYPEALRTTLEIAERVDIRLKLGGDAGVKMPTYQPPDGSGQKAYLIAFALDRLEKLYPGRNLRHPVTEEDRNLRARFEHELAIIERTGFINYFLVVQDFVNWAKQRGIPVGPGRGSGAGSLIAYAIGITEVDPIRYNLIFERFLNPDRVSPPDFDIDFCQSRRGEVIEYVKKKYGLDHCAQIITFGSLGAKTVIRDLARVLEIPLSEADRLAKLIPEKPDITLEDAEKLNPDFKRAVESDPNAQRILRYARVLEGLPRNQGVHAAGVVIGPEPLLDMLPLCLDKEKNTVTQYEMKPMEETGLLKMDFLGLKTLTVIQETLDLVNQIRGAGSAPDFPALEMDDPATYALLNRGDTAGVFQVESKGMQELLRQFQLAKFEDLIMLIAIYRPGPMAKIPEFVGRRHGRVKIEYDHPLLEKVLGETYGLFVYQEQVQQAANLLAGFTLAQGDLLRRAMGKKDKQIMDEQRQKFVEGCATSQNIPAAQATAIFDTIEKFAEYGFNKSHSACYAVLSYRTAYLKAHFPAEFMAAMMTSEMGNPDKLPFFIAQAKAMGLKMLPPDVQHSHERFRPEGKGAIRFGLGGIKNVGFGAVEAIVAERQAKGPFAGFFDFVNRMDAQAINKKVLESLIKAGAFDSTGISRARLFKGIEFALNRRAAEERDRSRGQISLFGALEMDSGSSGSASDAGLPDGEDWPVREMLNYEKELAGFYISGHPLEEFALETRCLTSHALEDVLEDRHIGFVRMCGLIADARKLFTKKDKEPMAAFRLDGLTGSIDAVIFPGSYRVHGAHVVDDLPVVVVAEVSREEDKPKLMVQEIHPLRGYLEQIAPRLERVAVHLAEDSVNEQRLLDARTLLQSQPGQTPVQLILHFGESTRITIGVEPKYRVRLDGPFLQKLRAFSDYDDGLDIRLPLPPPPKRFVKRDGPPRRNG